MSINCKIVKGLSWLSLLYGLFVIIVGILTLVGTDVANLVSSDLQLAAQVMGVLMIVFGLFYMVTGFVGARGANRPSKLGPFIVLATIIAVVNLIELATMFVDPSGGTFWMPLLFAVVAIVAVVFASRAKNEASSL